MRLSAENELLLKAAVESADREREIARISARIEKMDQKLSSEFDTGYLDVIEKCAALESLQSGMKELKQNSEDLYGRIREIQLRQQSMSEEYESIEKAMGRLKEVQVELTQIYEFVILARDLDNTDDIYYFVKGFDKMRQLKGCLKRYNFYRAFDGLYQSIREGFIRKLGGHLREWLWRLEYVETGKSIDLADNTGIFDKLMISRKHIIDVNFLKIVYASRKLEIGPRVVGTLDRQRRRILEQVRRDMGLLAGNRRSGSRSGSENSSNESDSQSGDSQSDGADNHHRTDPSNARHIVSRTDDLIYFSVSFLLLDHFISEYYTLSTPLIGDVFDILDQHDFTDHLNILILLKHTSRALRLDPSHSDAIIERSACQHFSRAIHDEHFFDDLNRFVDSSTSFLEQVTDHNTELGELLAKRVDQLLVDRISSDYDQNHPNDPRHFSSLCQNTRSTINKLISLKLSLVRYDFASIEMIHSRATTFIDDKYNHIKALAHQPGPMDPLIQEILTIRHFLDEDSRSILIHRLNSDFRGWLSDRRKDDQTLVSDTLSRNFPAEMGLDIRQ